MFRRMFASLFRNLIALIFVIILAALVADLVYFKNIQGYFNPPASGSQQRPPTVVSTVEVESVTWKPGLEAIGTARASRGVSLSIETGGVVTSLAFDANDQVEDGQILLEIDQRIEEADLAAAQASLELAQSELNRAMELERRGVGTADQVDEAQSQATNARAQMAKLNAVLEQKMLAAPFSGVMGIPQIEVGEYVSPGMVFGTLQDLSQMTVDFTLPEQQVSMVKIGMPITASAESMGLELTGKISAIEPLVDANSRLVSLRATIDNPEGNISPGQFLRVRVNLPDESGVLALPQTAVNATLYGDSVFVVNNTAEPDSTPSYTIEEVFVQAGRREGSRIEIVSGLEAGQQVVAAGQNRLSSGSPVTIDNSVSPTNSSSGQ